MLLKSLILFLKNKIFDEYIFARFCVKISNSLEVIVKQWYHFFYFIFKTTDCNILNRGIWELFGSVRSNVNKNEEGKHSCRQPKSLNKVSE